MAHRTFPKLRALCRAGAPNGSSASLAAHGGNSHPPWPRQPHTIPRAPARGGVARTWPGTTTLMDHRRRFMGARNRECSLGMARVRVGGTPDRRAKIDLGSVLRNV